MIVLDILLPEIDGFSVCKQLRAKGIKTPIIMLTCLGTIEERIKGLDAGGDDYLVKPFVLPELLARIRALLRREKDVKPVILRVGDLTLDPATHEVRTAERTHPAFRTKNIGFLTI